MRRSHPFAAQVKNEAELSACRAAHVRDGAAACRAFAAIERRVRQGDALDEVDVDAILLRERAKERGFLGPSFDTIAGYGPNGAIVHYRAARPTCAALGVDSFLLVDSGAQYDDGTTDATRTWHFGVPTDAEMDAYTAVLKGHVGLATATFPEDTPGFVLDAFARKPLWAAGLDYGHGTGHGVGAALNVHEGPQSISPRFANAEPLRAGMVVSNEPGYYEDGAFGVRLENLYEIRPVAPRDAGDRPERNAAEKAFLDFDVLTLIPIDTNALDVAALDDPERAFLDAYHARVLAAVGPLLDGDDKAWLEARCAPLQV